MTNPEIEKQRTTFSIVVNDRRFPVDDFYIDRARRGYVIIRKDPTNVPSLIDSEVIEALIHRNKGLFQVWDYSNLHQIVKDQHGARTVWCLYLEVKKEYDDYDIFRFRYPYTHPELIVALVLKRKCIDFSIQVPIDNFLADFFISPNIILEVDGPYHEDDDQRKKDEYREKRLRSYGFKVEHISYFMTDLSKYLVSGEIPPKDLIETGLLEDLETRIDTILAKRSLNDESLNYLEDTNPHGLT